MRRGRAAADPRTGGRRHVIGARPAAFGLVMIAIAILTPGQLASAAEPAEPRSILLIYADARLLPAIVSVDESLRATVESRASAPARFYTEYLDISWFPARQQPHIGAAMREKYAGRTFDVIMACGESALRFALEQRDALFPGVPIVFSLVEDDTLRGVTLPPDVTGVTTFRNWTAGIDLVLELHPRTRRIAFVSGASDVERDWERLARQVFARYGDRLAFTYLTGLSMDKTVAAVAALPEDSVILFNALLRDGAGRPFSSAEALARLVPAAKVPIYGYAETQLGHGIVGGSLVSYRAQAIRAGELAVRVLAGERLGPGDIRHREPARYMFDARQLARWRIPEQRLPAGSLVSFRPPSLRAEYGWYAVGALAFIAVQSLLIASLLVERRRRRRVQRGLDERLRFETLLADLAAGFVEIPTHEIDDRIRHDLGRTIAQLGLDRAGLAEFGPGSDVLRITHAGTRDGIQPLTAAFRAVDWPWTFGRLGSGHTIRVERLIDLPSEADRDRRSFERAGTKSIVMVPLVVGGRAVGGLAFSMVTRERAWPEDLVQRFQVLANIFAMLWMRRRADHALIESEGRFETMVDAAPVLIWMAGPDGRCIHFNRTWLQFTGRTLAQELGDGWLEGVHPDDRDACMATYGAALAARRSFTIEYRLRHADGSYRDVLDSGVPYFDADQVFRGYLGSATDVTEVKAARQSLVESLALRSAILGSLYGQVAALDRTGVIIAVNESWNRWWEQRGGAPGGAGVGTNYLEVCRRAAEAGDGHARAAFEALVTVLDGRSARALLEYPCVTTSGIEWYAMIVEPFQRPEGGVVVSHIDVTRRRRAEEEARRERDELAHVLRVATLGELATSLAHEINQPLAAIATNAQAAGRLLASAPVDPDIRDMLRDIADEAQRAGHVIRRLRTLFKKEHGERQPVDLGEVIKEVIALLRRELERRRVWLDLSLAPDSPRVLGDIVQLQQAILNVVMNALEAMGQVAGARELGIETTVREPGILTITVRDSGPGVPPSELERIFDRFVTTKPDGLGMGLSISRSIVAAHGGRMWATRNPDRGLTVHIELPCLEPARPPKVS